MKVPNADRAVVSRAKVVDYLLSDTHVDGRHKAVFFRRFGYSPERPREMVEVLKRHAREHEIVAEEPSPFGRRFVVEGIISAPDGRTPLVRTVWFLPPHETAPRFVTAYPLRRRSAKG